MRAFVALPLSNNENRVVTDLQKRLRSIPLLGDFRWIPSANIHMTLQFLGEIPEEKVADAASAVDSVIASRRPAPFSLGCLGVYPRFKNPSVLWAGPRHPPKALLELAGSLVNELEVAGFALESRPFRPHLTLARRKRNARSLKGLNVLLKEAEERWLSPPIPIQPTETVLFRSELRSEGAVYQAVHRISFLH